MSDGFDCYPSPMNLQVWKSNVACLSNLIPPPVARYGKSTSEDEGATRERGEIPFASRNSEWGDAEQSVVNPPCFPIRNELFFVLIINPLGHRLENHDKAKRHLSIGSILQRPSLLRLFVVLSLSLSLALEQDLAVLLIAEPLFHFLPV